MSGIEQSLTERQAQFAEAWKAGDLDRTETLLTEAYALAEENGHDDWMARLARNGVVMFQRSGRYDLARQWLARLRPFCEKDGRSDPEMDFIEGSIAFDAGDRETARRLFADLLKAYGKRPFQGADPKYLKFAESEG